MHHQFGVLRHTDKRQPCKIAILHDDVRLDLDFGTLQGTTCREPRTKINIGSPGHVNGIQVHTGPATITKRHRDLTNPREVAVDGRHTECRPPFTGGATALIVQH